MSETARLNCRKAESLLGCQLRVPHIHDEDQPERLGILPHLVLKGVVEDEHLAFFPGLGLVGTSDFAALLGDHQAQVHPEPAVRGSRVRPHVGSWVHDGILDLSSSASCCFREFV